jgi:hypothetical protein
MPTPMLVACNSTFRIARCRALCAPLYPSLALSWVTARKGFARCCRDVKVNLPDMAGLVVHRVGTKQVGPHRRDCPATKCLGGSRVTEEPSLDV